MKNEYSIGNPVDQELQKNFEKYAEEQGDEGLIELFAECQLLIKSNYSMIHHMQQQGVFIRLVSFWDGNGRKMKRRSCP